MQLVARILKIQELEVIFLPNLSSDPLRFWEIKGRWNFHTLHLEIWHTVTNMKRTLGTLGSHWRFIVSPGYTTTKKYTNILINIIWLVVSTPRTNISQLGLLFPIYGKINHVPNHQPVMISPLYCSFHNMKNATHQSFSRFVDGWCPICFCLGAVFDG